MSALVIDASITLSWLLPDETTDLSVTVRAEIPKAEVVWVPAHFRLEVCNSLWMAERRKRLDAAGVAQAADLFIKIPVQVDPETNERVASETLSLARQHALSVYDAAYLELALRRGAALASLDEGLRAVAKTLGTKLLPKNLRTDADF